MSKTFQTRIKQKRDTHTNWTSNNPVLLDGEIAIVDTEDGKVRQKIGDGSSAYNSLEFLYNDTIFTIDDSTELEVQGPEYLKYTTQSLTDDQKAQARTNIGAANSNTAALKTQLCNPNLLDNWYFGNPVNQRGQTSYSGEWSYSIDRWKMGNRATSLNVTSVGLEMNDVDLIQVIEKPEILLGKTITASALDTNGNLFSVTATMPNTFSGEWTRWGVFGNENWRISIDGTNDITIAISAITGAATTTFVAAKLELGDTQTLAHQENGVWVLNEIPNYADELAKCAQYNPTTGTHGGPHTMVKLWENASPSSDFGAQTISIPTLFDYDFIFVTTITSAVALTSGQYQPTVYIPVLVGAGAAISSFSSGGSDMWGHCRTVTIASNGVTFGNGHQIQFGGSIFYNWPNRSVPTAIYGIKGVL